MPFATLENASLYYEIHGHGHPLVLIAGYTCDHTFWEALLPLLTPSFKVLIFDNRGMGQSPDLKQGFTIHDMAKDVIQLCDQLGFENFFLLGQSMGGAIAQAVARLVPHRLHHLFIVNSVMKFSPLSLLALQSLLQLREAGISSEHLLDATLPWIFSNDFLTQPQQYENLKAHMLQHPVLQSINNQKSQLDALRNFDASSWCHQLQVPTTVLAAKDDILTRSEESFALAKVIPDARFFLLDGGHASPIEQPEEVAEFLLRIK